MKNGEQGNTIQFPSNVKLARGATVDRTYVWWFAGPRWALASDDVCGKAMTTLAGC